MAKGRKKNLRERLSEIGVRTVVDADASVDYYFTDRMLEANCLIVVSRPRYMDEREVAKHPAEESVTDIDLKDHKKLEVDMVHPCQSGDIEDGMGRADLIYKNRASYVVCHCFFSADPVVLSTEIFHIVTHIVDCIDRTSYIYPEGFKGMCDRFSDTSKVESSIFRKIVEDEMNRKFERAALLSL